MDGEGDMRQFFLKRVSNTDDGVFGVLLDGATPFAITLENPWRDNKKNESCIPIGLYRCERVLSRKFGHTFEVIAVQGRSNILFHKGNLEDDTLGCILVGEQFETLNGKTAILQSGKGYGEFMDRLNGEDRFALNIMWA